MPEARVTWNLPDSRLATRGLSLAVDAPTFLESGADAEQTNGIPSFYLPNVPLMHGQRDPGSLLGGGAAVLMMHPRLPDTPGLSLGDLRDCSTDTREVTNAYGRSDTWLLCMTDSLSSRGLSEKYLLASAALGFGEALCFDLSVFSPPEPTAFRAELQWAETLSLRIAADGKAALYETTGGTERLRAVDQLFNVPFWQRPLQVIIMPLRNRTVWIGSNDCRALAWTPVTPLVQVSPRHVSPFGPGRPGVYVQGATFYAAWNALRYATVGGDTTVLAKGPLMTLDQTYSGGLGLDYEADTQPGTGIVAWLEDASGNLTNSGRYVRPCFSLACDAEGKFSPFVYCVRLTHAPVIVSAGMASAGMASAGMNTIDLSDWWESIQDQNSLDDLCLEAEVRLRPDAPVDSLSPQLQRLAGVDLDGTAFLRAYLTPEIETDGIYDRLILRGRGRMSRLERSLFDGAETFAGLTHTEAMEQVLQGAGFSAEDYVIAADPEAEPRKLPTRDGAEHDPTVPDIGTTRREFSQWICDRVSGWQLTELLDGRLLYAPPSSTNRGIWDETGGLPLNRTILADSWREDRAPDKFRNEIWVVGQTAAGEPLVGVYLNDASQHDPEADDFVGERRLLIYLDPSLTTEDLVENALDLLVADMGTDKRRATFRSGYDPAVATGDLLTARGLEWRILRRQRTVGPPEATAFVTYEVEQYVAA